MKTITVGFLAVLTLLKVSGSELEWMTNLSQAIEKAKAENKMVLLDFTGSDWCPPCKALHKNVLSSPEFAEYAQKNLVLVEVDFPREKPQSEELKKSNRELAKKYEVRGYPTIVVLDGNGKVLSKKTGYGGEKPAAFIARLEQLKR